MSDDLYKEVFSKKLKYYMELNNKTQADLINDLGVSSSTISNWCTGLKLPRMGKIQMLADYFHINKSDLIEEMPVYVIGENGKREVRYSDNLAMEKEKDNDTLLAEMGIKRTNYIMSKKNERTELSDNEYDFLINSLELFRKNK